MSCVEMARNKVADANVTCPPPTSVPRRRLQKISNIFTGKIGKDTTPDRR